MTRTETNGTRLWPRQGEEIELTRLIHRGKRNWVFEGHWHGERYAIKLPNLRTYAGCSASMSLDSEVFVKYSVSSTDFAEVRERLNWEELFELFPHVVFPDDVILDQLLHSEYDILKRAGSAWNSDAIGITHWTAGSNLDGAGRVVAESEARHSTPVRSRGSRAAIVLPYYDETPLDKLPEGLRYQLWLNCLPSLWTAIEKCRHGDLNPGNLLISADRTFFRLVDPCSACIVGSSYDEAVCFVTTPHFYPLYPPFNLNVYLGARISRRLREADEGTNNVSMPLPLPLLEFGDEALPSAADRCALGLITYYLLTGTTLTSPDEQPAWTKEYRSPFFPEEKLPQVLNACQSELARLNRPGIRRLIEGLITLQISTRSELEKHLREL